MDYCCFGNGSRPFVIIPGLSVKPVSPGEKLIAAAYAEYAEDFKVYVFDRRSNMPEKCCIEQMAEDTAAVMKSLGIRDACVFGASQGGMIAQSIAMEYPELVGKLIIGSSSARKTTMLETALTEWAEYARKRDAHGLNESMAKYIYSKEVFEANLELFCEMEKAIKEEDYEPLLININAMLKYDREYELDKICCETLVIGCEGDRVMGVEASRVLADELGCELYIFGDEYGHGVYDETPEFQKIMLEFCKR